MIYNRKVLVIHQTKEAEKLDIILLLVIVYFSPLDEMKCEVFKSRLSIL